MQKIVCSILAVILAVCAIQALAAPSQSTDSRKAAKQEQLVRVLRPLRQLVVAASELQAVIAKELPGKVGDMAKRQSAWDLDYGWGGGRFGKRAEKRYDMYGFGGGRFGRDVDHVDVDAHH